MRIGRPRRWMVQDALLLTLIIVIVVVWVTGGKTPPRANGEHPGRTRPTSQSPACPDGSGSGSSTIPTAPPPDLAWKNIGAIIVPSSATAGPARSNGAVWSCYAHSPTGALMAAYDIFAALASPGWRTAAEQQIVPGPGQHAFITAGEHQSYRPPQPGQVPQPVGFEMVSYTPQQATIETLSNAGFGDYLASQRTVAWANGDWKLVVTPDGRTGPDPQLVTSTNGFVPWGDG